MSDFLLIFLFLFGGLLGFIGGFSSGALHEMKKCGIRIKMFAKHHGIEKED